MIPAVPPSSRIELNRSTVLRRGSLARLAGGAWLFVVGALAASAGAGRVATLIDLRGQADLRIVGRQSLDHLGRSFAVGDFNTDGRPDIAVGVPDADSTGNVAGEVYVLFGQPTVSGYVDMAERSPDVEIGGGTDEGRLGYNMAVADLNGDGVDDLVVLDYNAGPPERQTAGTSHVFFGGTDTWNRSLIDLTQASGDVVIWGAVNGEHAGAVYLVADLNADGIDDLVLGAPASNRSEERVVNSGAVYVLHGRPDLAGPVDLLTDAALRIRGADEAGFFGSSLALGDVDGDGSIDLVVGARGLDRGQAVDAGAVYVFLDVAGMAGLVDVRARPPDLTLWGAERQLAGSSLAVADVDGDGQADLLVGAPTASPAGRYRAGIAGLVLGPLDTEQPELELAAVADVVIWGPAAYARAGDAVALWDLGGDGLAELIVNVPEANVDDRPLAGFLALWSGRQSFGDPILDLAGDEPDVAVWGDDAYTRGAWYLAGNRDLDGSGYPDLLIGISDTRPEGRNGAGTVYALFDILAAQPTPSPSASPTPSATPSPTETPAPSPTPTDTATPTLPPSATPTPSATPSATATPSPSATATPSPSATATASPEPSPTPTQSPTTTITLTPTATHTPAVYLPLLTRP